MQKTKTTPRRGAGRPPSAEARTENTAVRLTPAELAKYRALADQDRRSLGDWIRVTLERATAEVPPRPAT